jgi:hypothetical protein
MKNLNKTAVKLITLGLFSLFLSACGGDPVVSFSQDVKPVLDKNCSQCHLAGGQGEVASGFDMSSYEGLMKGAQFGQMIIAGDAQGSNMLVLMEGRADPSISMPHGEQKSVSKEDIQTVRLWIEQGAKNN